MHTALDTSGFLGASATDEMLDDIDLVLLDVKAGPAGDLQDGHRPRARSRRCDSAAGCATRGTPIWIRYVLVPGLTDGDGERRRRRGLRRLASGDGRSQRVEVLPFHQMGRDKWKALDIPYPLEHTQPPTRRSSLTRVRETFRSRGLHVLTAHRAAKAPRSLSMFGLDIVPGPGERAYDPPREAPGPGPRPGCLQEARCPHRHAPTTTWSHGRSEPAAGRGRSRASRRAAERWTPLRIAVWVRRRAARRPGLGDDRPGPRGDGQRDLVRLRRGLHLPHRLPLLLDLHREAQDHAAGRPARHARGVQRERPGLHADRPAGALRPPLRRDRRRRPAGRSGARRADGATCPAPSGSSSA